MVARAKLMLLVLSEYIGTFSTFNTFETLVLVLLWYFWNTLVLLKYFGGTHMFLCEANGREPSWWRPEMNSQFGSWEEAAGRGRGEEEQLVEELIRNPSVQLTRHWAASIPARAGFFLKIPPFKSPQFVVP